MLCAKKGDEIVHARATSKQEAPFSCPECNEEVILKQGQIRIEHFAHKVECGCSYGVGETYETMKCKKEIYQQISSDNSISNCMLDRKILDQRLDISFKKGTKRIAIQIIKKTDSVEEIESKIFFGIKENIYWLFVFPYENKFNKDIANINEREKFIHAISFGRLYLRHVDKIRVIHLAEKSTWVEGNDFGGGYFKKYKNKKQAIFGQEMDIIKSFSTKELDKSDKFMIPKRKLYLDNQKTWW